MLIRTGDPCNDCGSSDALATYSNGSYCFSCSKYTSGTNTGKTNQSYNYQEDRMQNNLTSIKRGSKGYKFLRERHLTEEQIFFYGIKQCEKEDYIQLPYHSYFSEIRYIGREGYSKYITLGDKSMVFTGRKEYDSCMVVVVEDMISAMRVGWEHHCMALRGTKLNSESLYKLASVSKECKIVLWLDSDEAGRRGVEKIKKSLDWTGRAIYDIITDRDAKMHTDEQINKIIEDNTK